MNIGERLVKIREEYGYTRKKLADELNRPYRTITNYENGEREPGHDYIIEIAKKFGVSTDYILGLSSTPDLQTKKSPSELSEEAHKIAKDYDRLTDYGKGAVKAIMEYDGKTKPVAASKQTAARPKVVHLPKIKRSHGFIEVEVFDQPAAAGLGNQIDAPPSHVEQYPSDYVPTKTNFGVLISGDSMEPKIPNGSTVFVQATPVLDNGEIGIFVLDGKAYCKQLKKDVETQQVKLHSLNPEYEDIEIPPFAELRTLGRVLGGYDPQTRDVI